MTAWIFHHRILIRDSQHPLKHVNCVGVVLLFSQSPENRSEIIHPRRTDIPLTQDNRCLAVNCGRSA